MKNITGEELRNIQNENKDVIVIDVRTSGEIQSGKIVGAQHLDFMSPDFADKIKSFDPSVPYVLVCQSGNRSRSAGGLMESNGFTTLYNLLGGMMLWNGEVEKI